jgi:hypothetical protein
MALVYTHYREIHGNPIVIVELPIKDGDFP